MKESPVFRDEDLSHKWGPSGNTAKLASVHWCSDNGYYDTKINDKGEWKFSASCSGSVPEGWSKRYTNESAQLLGYQTARDAAKEDCSKKGYMDVTNEENLGGHWDYSFKCADVKWDIPYSGIDSAGNKLTVRECIDWVGFDPNSCFKSVNKPKDMKKWISCALGSSPGGIVNGKNGVLCYPLSKDVNDFTCSSAHHCYAVTGLNSSIPTKPDINVPKTSTIESNKPIETSNTPTKPSSTQSIDNAKPPKSNNVIWSNDNINCSGGKKTVLKKCSEWVDPTECLTTKEAEKVEKWLNCQKNASFKSNNILDQCDTPTKEFSCKTNGECYGLISEIYDTACEESKPEIKQTFTEKYKNQIIAIVVIIAILLIIGVGLTVYLNVK
jgi:hypothetical protein